MLSHSNAFIPKMNEEERHCFDDYADQIFTTQMKIAVKPDALLAPDIRELEDHLHTLIFAFTSYGCINLDKSAYFRLTVRSVKNGVLYETRHQRFEDPRDVIWDERKIWLDLRDDYSIEISLDDSFGKTVDFWYWLEESDAVFWSEVEIKGFLHCNIDPAVAACFRKGGGKKDIFVSTLDLPSESADWIDGSYEDASMTADWFSMSIDVYSQSLWDRIVPPVLQIAAVNRIDCRPGLSLWEKVTNEHSREKAAAVIAEHKIRFYPSIEVGAGSKYLLEQSIREILTILSQADSGFFRAQTYTGFFYNRESLYLEIWDFNPDTFELVISHTEPIN